jgi:hypothetical protein
MISRALIPALSCIMLAATASHVGAQSDSSRRLVPFVSLGASHAARGVDSPGAHIEAGFIRALGHGFSVRVEAARHSYGEVPVAPCLLQDSERCYQVVDRQVTAGIVNAVYGHSVRGTELYLISGMGVYGSHRVATRYPACQVAGPCETRTYKLDIRDTQLGVNGGIGAETPVRSVPLFMDLRVHYMYRTTPSGRPGNDYFLVPFTVGLRF